jgi:hypothetical protein
MKTRMKEIPSDKNVEQCMSAIKDNGTEQNSNPKLLMQIFLLLQTYSYQAILILITIFMFNILFLWQPHYLSADSLNQNSANLQTKFNIVTIFLILNFLTIFQLSNFYVIYSYLEIQFKMTSANISPVVAIKAETKGIFSKIAYYITFWTQITTENKLIFPRSLTTLQRTGLAESV